MWHEGYTSEINYTYGYYPELSPSRIRLALLSCGIDHSIADDPTYLELGFGQGLSLNINAATNSGTFFGTDFNPGQVANARGFADAMGKPLALFEDSFEDMARRDDLPQFDIIALHGIWSWINDASRAGDRRYRAEEAEAGRRALHQLQRHSGLVAGHSAAHPHGRICQTRRQWRAGRPDRRVARTSSSR